MFRIRTLTVAALAVTLLLPSVSLAGLGSDKTMYLGGTVTGVKEKTEGKSSTTDETVFTFKAKKTGFDIPYEQINSLEYGEKAGRRIGVAVVVNPLRLVDPDGDVIWSTTQESRGAKYKGASADAAEKITKVLLREVARIEKLGL